MNSQANVYKNFLTNSVLKTQLFDFIIQNAFLRTKQMQ